MKLVNDTPNIFFFSCTICRASQLATVNISVDMALEDDKEFRRDYVIAIARKLHVYQGYQLHLVKIEWTCIMSH